MSQYQEIKQRIAQLEKEAEEIRKSEIKDAIAQVGEIMSVYDISVNDLVKELGGRGKKLPPKYRDPDSGKTWSGKGRQPKWFDPENENRFLIA